MTTVNTTIQQSSGQRNQRIAARSLYTTLAIIAALEFPGWLREQYSSLVSWENSVIFTSIFLLIFAYAWLTGKRNIQIKFSHSGVEISHDEEIVRFSWHEVKQWRQPMFIMKPYWLFELQNARKIKLSIRCFSIKQRRQIRDALAAVTGRIHG